MSDSDDGHAGAPRIIQDALVKTGVAEDEAKAFMKYTGLDRPAHEVCRIVKLVAQGDDLDRALSRPLNSRGTRFTPSEIADMDIQTLICVDKIEVGDSLSFVGVFKTPKGRIEIEEADIAAALDRPHTGLNQRTSEDPSTVDLTWSARSALETAKHSIRHKWVYEMM